MEGVWKQQIKSARSTFAALLKQLGKSLNDESLRTLLVEVEGMINSRPITCDNVGDVNSIVPLNSMQLLSMKTKIVMPPPGIFQKTGNIKNIGNGFNMYVMRFGLNAKRKFLLLCSLFRNGIAQVKFSSWRCTVGAG